MPTDTPVVLVVDDEVDLAELFSQWLTDDYTVRTAYGGEEALERLDETVEVVLLDRRMPEVSGDEVLDRIREYDYDCRVALVTAVHPDYDIIELGFDDYVTKPVSNSDLHDLVEDMLTLATYDQTLQEFYAALATRGVLDAEKPPSELANNEQYEQLNIDIDAFESELDGSEAELTAEDLEAGFRDLVEADDE